MGHGKLISLRFQTHWYLLGPPFEDKALPDTWAAGLLTDAASATFPDESQGGWGEVESFKEVI